MHCQADNARRYPETSNVRLEDIDLMFSSGGNPVKVAKEIIARNKAGLSARDEEHVEGKETQSIEVEKTSS